MKKRKLVVAKKFFVVGSIMLWLIIILFSFYVLKTGGHLKPKAVGVENAGFNVSGRVTFDGKAVVGAKITAFENDLNNYTYSDSEGSYTFGNLFGAYKLRVVKEGYKSTEVDVVAQDGKFQNILLNR